MVNIFSVSYDRMRVLKHLNFFKFVNRFYLCEGEMSQQLRALAIPTEYVSWIPSTHSRAQNHVYLVPGDPMSFSGLLDACCMDMVIHRHLKVNIQNNLKTSFIYNDNEKRKLVKNITDFVICF